MQRYAGVSSALCPCKQREKMRRREQNSNLVSNPEVKPNISGCMALQPDKRIPWARSPRPPGPRRKPVPRQALLPPKVAAVGPPAAPAPWWPAVAARGRNASSVFEPSGRTRDRPVLAARNCTAGAARRMNSTIARMYAWTARSALVQFVGVYRVLVAPPW